MCGMEDSTCYKERPKRFLQLSFEDKKCYIAYLSLSLMGEIDPRVLLNEGFSQESLWLPSLK